MTNVESDIFLARQPIFDKSLNVVAYELLFRQKPDEYAEINDPDDASCQIINNIFTHLGIDKVTDNMPAFINVTRNLLLKGVIDPLPKDKVVIEVLEDITAEPEIIEALAKYKKLGFKIALDDYIYSEDNKDLLKFADIVKLDILSLSQEELKHHIDTIQQYNIPLLAEKIETYEAFEHCSQLGCTLFQGYFLCQPRIVSGGSVPTSRNLMMELLTQLQNAESKTEEISELISQDVRLSFKLLRVLNSASMGLEREIGSVHEAVVLIGLEQIRHWANLIILSNASDKPHALFLTTLLRAKMCESLARLANLSEPSQFYTIGLFSTLDAMLDQPMANLLKQLPLSEDIKVGLLHGNGDLGRILKLVIDYELGNWKNAKAHEFEEEQLSNAYITSLVSAQEMCRMLYL